ncbi:hypothetical protein CYY_000459 [Polysphondylium violaceum]|uniref:FNIP repeat-containing protein n=1 Tax=Polysphondylium violaceum TaxID=133409 RepID=A0A8J4VBK0_9MYCE|nr:hypothetical protein CYY_000459 [Polysphondylium violaceum]
MHSNLFHDWCMPSFQFRHNVPSIKSKLVIEIGDDGMPVEQSSPLGSIHQGDVSLTLEIKNHFPHQKVQLSQGNCNTTVYKFEKGHIPPTITYLKIYEVNAVLSDHSFIFGCIPPSVTCLQLTRFNENSAHLIPKTVKQIEFIVFGSTLEKLDLPNSIEKCVISTSSRELKVGLSPQFTSPIHLVYDQYYPSPDKSQLFLANSNVEIIDYHLKTEALDKLSFLFPSSTKSLSLFNFNHCLSTIQFPPQLKYLRLDSVFNQIIYDNAHLPITLTHLHLEISSTKDSISLDWLEKKGYLPKSLTHIKLTFDKKGCIPFTTILLPSSIQCVCINTLDGGSTATLENRPNIKIIDKQDYYSFKPPIIICRIGLKELIIRQGFKQTLHPNILVTTLQHLSLTNCFPTSIPLSLTSLSFSQMYKPDESLDLSQHHSLTKLSIFADRIAQYPPNVKDLSILNENQDNWNLTFNKSSIFKLSIKSNHFGKIFKGSEPTLQNLKHLIILGGPFDVKNIPPSVEIFYTNGYINSKIPSSVKEAHFLEFNKYGDLIKPIQPIPLKDTIILKQSPTPLDRFLIIWRDFYLKGSIMEKLFKLIPTDLFLEDKDILKQIDRFPRYNIISRSSEPYDLIRFKPEKIYMGSRNIQSKLLSIIPKSTTKLKCVCIPDNPIPSWITTLELIMDNYDNKIEEIPNSVTDLSLFHYNQKIEPLVKGKIPLSVSKLTLQQVDNLRSIIPPSVTQLTLIRQNIDTLSEKDIPPTIQHINLVGLFVKGEGTVLSEYISTRLTNGKYFIYKSLSKTTNTPIPKNITHLIWNGWIIREGDIPNNVHTLVICKDSTLILSLPSSITQLIFNCRFEQNFLRVAFPPALKYLQFNNGLSKPLEFDYFPKRLSHLYFDGSPLYNTCNVPQSVSHWSSNVKVLDFNFPSNVKHIKVSHPSTTNAPLGVKSMMVSFPRLCQYETSDSENNRFFSPSTQLHLYSFRNIHNLPLVENIKSIHFSDLLLSQGFIPDNVESLQFQYDHSSFNPKISQQFLPQSLKILKLGFSQAIVPITSDTFPASLTELHLGRFSCDSLIENHLPHLTKLVCFYYHGILDMCILPKTLTDLDLWSRESTEFPIHLVPLNITNLSLSRLMYIQSPHLVPSTIKSLSLCRFIVPGLIPTTVESLTLDSNQLHCLYYYPNQENHDHSLI